MIKVKNYVGKQITIQAGTKVLRAGKTAKRSIDTIVTIRSQENVKGGKTRVFWKSNGLRTSTVL